MRENKQRPLARYDKVEHLFIQTTICLNKKKKGYYCIMPTFVMGSLTMHSTTIIRTISNDVFHNINESGFGR